MLSTSETFRDQQLAEVLGLVSDEFVVLQIIRGGMGAVAKVRSAMGRVFALKFLELNGEPRDVLERFRREVQMWESAAACDAVVDVLGVVRINEMPAVCAEWMPGGDLNRLMLVEEPAIFYSTLDRIIAALDWVYQKYKIIHRDIKPSNLLLDDAGRPFISDWGIGRVSFEFDSESRREGSEHGGNRLIASSSTLTQTGRLLGTIPYCSPEQILSSNKADFRSDMYSLGCLMYQWETGRLPFEGSRWEEVARKHLESQVPRVAGIFRKSRFGAEEVINRCLEKNPDDRFGSYAELREALRDQAVHRKVKFPRNDIASRRWIPLVGHNRLSQHKPSVVGTKGYGVIESEIAQGFLREASALTAVGEWQKAYDIYSRLWLPGFYPEGCAEVSPNIMAAVNMGLCLVNLSRPEEAIQILQTIPESQRIHAPFFVNLGNALNHLGKFAEAEGVSARGLTMFPQDGDLLGNLTTALIMQHKYLDALPHALARLKRERNVHSLEEAASVLKSLGTDLVCSDFPKGIESLTAAAELLGEALALNPLYSSARWNLAQTLFDIGLFSEAIDVATKLPKGPVWGKMQIILVAESLNRTSAAKECLEFCAKWKAQLPNEVDLQRVEAETLADFYCIGKQDSAGRKVVISQCVDFFNAIVKDGSRRKLSDFGYLSRLGEWLDQPEAAVSAVMDAHSIYGDKWEVFFAYAWLDGRVENWQAAHCNSKKACELAPWHPPVWIQRSWIEENLAPAAAPVSRAKADELNWKIDEMRKSTLELLRSKGVLQ